MTIKQAKHFIFIITIFVILMLIILTFITKPTSIHIGESYANKTVEPKETFPIYNMEQNYSYQPGNVRTLPNISVKEN